MSNIGRYYTGYARGGQYLQQLAAELGVTPRQLFEGDFDFFDFLVSAHFPADGLIHATFRGGVDMITYYQPATLTVTHIEMRHNGDLVYEWSGMMSAQQFLNVEWPESIVYGSAEADWLWIEDGGTVYAGAGNDIIEVYGSGLVHGEAGQDVFVLSPWHGGNIRIADYQPGEKILFDSYDDFAALVQNFKGVSAAGANGFTLNFGTPYLPHWSLTIEGASLEQMRVEDLLVGQAAWDQVYAHVLAAYGIA